MLVHAHPPDDEVTSTAITMAHHVGLGDRVTLVTCTLGEEGDIVVDDLKNLRSEDPDALGRHRIGGELTEAMRVLGGVTDFVRLGGDGKYRDSGMAVDEQGRVIPVPDATGNTFWSADLTEAATDLAVLIRDRRPQVLITYDQYGSYGHPDHIQAHRVAMYGSQLAAVPSYRPDLGGEAWAVPRMLWTAMAESGFREGLRRMQEAGRDWPWGGTTIRRGGRCPDGHPGLRHRRRGVRPERGEQKLQAFRAHASQIPTDFFLYQLSDTLGPGVLTRESYRFAGGVPVPKGAKDIFSGL